MNRLILCPIHAAESRKFFAQAQSSREVVTFVDGTVREGHELLCDSCACPLPTGLEVTAMTISNERTPYYPWEGEYLNTDQLFPWVVISHDPDEQQWFFDHVVASCAKEAEAFIARTREYCQATIAIWPEDLIRMGQKIQSRTTKDILKDMNKLSVAEEKGGAS